MKERLDVSRDYAVRRLRYWEDSARTERIGKYGARVLGGLTTLAGSALTIMDQHPGGPNVPLAAQISTFIVGAAMLVAAQDPARNQHISQINVDAYRDILDEGFTDAS